MALEAERVLEAAERSPNDRRARSERRGKERRVGGRINKAAPRRSMMKAYGAWATGMSFAIFAIVFLATILVSTQIPWMALAVSAAAVVTSLFALMLGSLEQRLIEIRLELMMGNGGMRQADRRSGDRRAIASPVDQSSAKSPKP
ncbi:hypothetical protein [Brevundimonas goettingensis]|uniref:Uncharacterized protein n=1 Tax=Brevundimonas goettingensis TaxID=2774190 RepID=A0A975C258_9CAUL|nr:hypothetical protein [Brevundimonas goettingensis]QTC90450.1 hypothetical protein IFJ75_14355 [Brevundimonas goettingensis]